MKKIILTTVAAAAIFSTGVLYAQRPKVNISPKKHPNLEAAEKLSQQAWEKITAAQKANEFDMDGHAQKAKDLLDQVTVQLRLAATAANKK